MTPVSNEGDGEGGRGRETAPALPGDSPEVGNGEPQIVAIQLCGITKVFPGVRANDCVNLLVKRGEVHCLLGENGAGKSTLMNVLAGIYIPEEGTIRVGGRDCAITCPRDSIDLGIGMVHQHSGLIPNFTVLDNLILGQGEGVRLSVKKAQEGLARLAGVLGVEVDPETEVAQLSLGQQQQVEIIKALWQGSKVLILDEPTSMLTPKGIEDLERVIVHLKEEGLAVIFITHKLHEAFAIGDCVSVLRQGRLEGTIDGETMKRCTPAELQRMVVDLMFPGEAESLANVAELHDVAELGGTGRKAQMGEPLLELVDVTVPGKHGEIGIEQGFSLTVHAGEVVGVAGVDGNGQRPLAEAIAGQRPISSGEIKLAGKPMHKLSIGARQRRGLRYVTDDRLGEGIVGPLSVAVNIVSKRIGAPPFWVHGRTRPAVIEAHAKDLIGEYNIMTPSTDTPAGSLSGGNIQKVVLARELSFDPQVVVFNKPTYGLDVKTTSAVRARVRELADGGKAGALVISTDLEELLVLSDRVAVLSRGRLMGIVENKPGAEQEIGALMIGGSHGE
jgi:general nucleoside transport system ATP-binding protein